VSPISQDQIYAKTYVGTYDKDRNPKWKLYANGEELYPERPIYEQAADEFEWGYATGQGCNQTALAILCDLYQNPLVAWRLHRDFLKKCISELDMDKPFELPEIVIRAMLPGDALMDQIKREYALGIEVTDAEAEACLLDDGDLYNDEHNAACLKWEGLENDLNALSDLIERRLDEWRQQPSDW
jgi:hypothetical protein